MFVEESSIKLVLLSLERSIKDLAKSKLNIKPNKITQSMTSPCNLSFFNITADSSNSHAEKQFQA